jgi:hypothetical protein
MLIEIFVLRIFVVDIITLVSLLEFLQELNQGRRDKDGKIGILAVEISSVILVDPVSILLHQSDVAYNFVRPLCEILLKWLHWLTANQIVRRPKLANEWLLWDFGSKDMRLAHTFSVRSSGPRIYCGSRTS